MIATLESKKNLMKSVEGLQSVRLIEIDDTTSLGISLYENAQQVVNAEKKIKELMSGMMPHITGPAQIMNGGEFLKFEL